LGKNAAVILVLMLIARLIHRTVCISHNVFVNVNALSFKAKTDRPKYDALFRLLVSLE